MDATGHMRASARHARAALALLTGAYGELADFAPAGSLPRIEAAKRLILDAAKELDAGAELSEHAVAYWTEQQRAGCAFSAETEPADAPLRRARDFLARAPGHPLTDEARAEYDAVMSLLGTDVAVGMIRSRGLAKAQGGEVWKLLRDEAAKVLAARELAHAERME